MKKYLLILPVLLLLFFLFSGQKSQEYIYKNSNDNVPSDGKRIYEMRGGGGIVAVNPTRLLFESPNKENKFVEAYTHPNNPNIFFAASVTNLGIGAYYTTNGGFSWSGSDTLSGQGSFGGYFKSAITSSGDFYLGLARDLLKSTNNGTTWSYAGSPPQLGHSSFGIDNNPSSPYFGRMYHTGQRSSVAKATFSTNSGITWDTLHSISDFINFTYPEGSDLAIGPEGYVYVCYSDVEYDGPVDDITEGPSYIVEKSVSFSRSTNGGVNWSVPLRTFISGVGRKYFLGNTIYMLNSFPKIDVDRSGGSRNGWVYIVETEREGSIAQDSADIVLRRSTNQGVSFPFQIRVNQDTPGNKKYQYIPAIKVDSYGGINIIYYDSRETSQEDSVKVYMSRSMDGGNTWTDFPISDRVFKPEFSGQEIHSLGLTESGNKLWPFWYSNESGNTKVYSTAVEIGPVIVHDKLGDSENLSGPYTVNAQIQENNSSISAPDTKLYWSRNGGAITNSVTMTNTGGNNWTANIPGNGSAAEYRYYITTQDMLGRFSTSPFGAPSGFNTFFAEPDTTHPMIEYTQEINRVALSELPLYIDLTINENAYIDSVYIKLYKNGQTMPTHISLQNLNGNRYAGQLIGNGQVVVGDSVRYKIFAVDNSTIGNVDSTELFKLMIYDVPFYEKFPLSGTGGEPWNNTRWTTSAYVIHRMFTGTLPFRLPSEPAIGAFENNYSATLKPINLGGIPETKLSLSFYGWQLKNINITYKDTNNAWKDLAFIPGPLIQAFPDNLGPPIEIEFPPDVNVSDFQFKIQNINGGQMFFDDIKIIRERQNTEIPFADNFSFPNLNLGNWNQTSGDFKVVNKDSTIGGVFPFSIPSEPYFLSVRGDGTLESRARDLSSFTDATLLLMESEHDLETNEKVYLEYFDNSRAWQPLYTFTGTDNNTFSQFRPAALVLPMAALHSDFKLRFRSEGLESDDEWLFDNIFINSGLITGSEISENSIPQRYELYQNYPNPFNPSTKIKFDIPRHGLVSLKVYDILGREIAKLVNGNYTPGSYTIEFNIPSLSSGIYFYRLEADDFTEIKKMVLLK